MHYIYVLSTEDKLAYVNYAQAAKPMRAKKAQLDKATGKVWLLRLAVVKAYANEVSMKNEELLATYIRLLEQGFTMVNKHVPGSPLEKEKALMSKPELWGVLSEEATSSPTMPTLPLEDADFKLKHPFYISDDNWQTGVRPLLPTGDNHRLSVVKRERMKKQ
jgi:hypothetical protein